MYKVGYAKGIVIKFLPHIKKSKLQHRFVVSWAQCVVEQGPKVWLLSLGSFQLLCIFKYHPLRVWAAATHLNLRRDKETGNPNQLQLFLLYVCS